MKKADLEAHHVIVYFFYICYRIHCCSINSSRADHLWYPYIANRNLNQFILSNYSTISMFLVKYLTSTLSKFKCKFKSITVFVSQIHLWMCCKQVQCIATACVFCEQDGKEIYHQSKHKSTHHLVPVLRTRKWEYRIFFQNPPNWRVEESFYPWGIHWGNSRRTYRAWILDLSIFCSQYQSAILERVRKLLGILAWLE